MEVCAPVSKPIAFTSNPYLLRQAYTDHTQLSPVKREPGCNMQSSAPINLIHPGSFHHHPAHFSHQWMTASYATGPSTPGITEQQSSAFDSTNIITGGSIVVNTTKSSGCPTCQCSNPLDSGLASTGCCSASHVKLDHECNKRYHVAGQLSSQWDVTDLKLPRIRQFDLFDLWPQGHSRLAYNRGASEGARRHVSGWAMRNTNNHNSQILKKSCLGVVRCSTPTCTLAMRPAICDKARRRQEGRVCNMPGCGGRLFIQSCRGHGGHPVTHFWREYGETVYFQAKGTHDHIRPDLKPVRETATRRRKQHGAKVVNKSPTYSTRKQRPPVQQSPSVARANRGLATASSHFPMLSPTYNKKSAPPTTPNRNFTLNNIIDCQLSNKLPFSTSLSQQPIDPNTNLKVNASDANLRLAKETIHPQSVAQSNFYPKFYQTFQELNYEKDSVPSYLQIQLISDNFNDNINDQSFEQKPKDCPWLSESRSELRTPNSYLGTGQTEPNSPKPTSFVEAIGKEIRVTQPSSDIWSGEPIQPIQQAYPWSRYLQVTTGQSFLNATSNNVVACSNSDSTSGGFNASWSTPSPPTVGNSSSLFSDYHRTGNSQLHQSNEDGHQGMARSLNQQSISNPTISSAFNELAWTGQPANNTVTSAVRDGCTMTPTFDEQPRQYQYLANTLPTPPPLQLFSSSTPLSTNQTGWYQSQGLIKRSFDHSSSGSNESLGRRNSSTYPYPVIGPIAFHLNSSDSRSTHASNSSDSSRQG